MTKSRLDQLAARFARLYTGALTDVLDRHGRREQTLSSGLAPLVPATRLAGPVFTVEGRPRPDHDYDASIRKVLTMLGAIPPGHVAVYQTNDAESAHFGELSATSLQARGCAGAVIDGGCRDVEFIARQGYPVFCRFTTPQDCVPRWECTRWGDAAITVGGVRVGPGDYIVGDADGVVVIPGELVDPVLAEAEAKAATESEIRVAVRKGMPPLEAYERFGTF
jgi:4-hydroxy-4-methyl-2-oxoglutarate aldolase